MQSNHLIASEHQGIGDPNRRCVPFDETNRINRRVMEDDTRHFLQLLRGPPMRRTPHIALGLAIALAIFAGPLNGLKAGEGISDSRSRLDPEKGPWRAVGKLQVATVNRRQTCTGTLIGPSTVLTAAHCVFNAVKHRNFAPASIHFLIGYDGSHYAGHGIGVKLETGPGFRYDPIQRSATAGSDWALIWLDTRFSPADRILPMIDHPPKLGSPVMLGGYQQDHPLVLMADTRCHILGSATDADGRPLIRHNCMGTRGVSGAPLLIEQSGKWAVGGVEVMATERGTAGGYAVVLDEARRHL
jgi:V8-like Glu-specific endopeptidase